MLLVDDEPPTVFVYNPNATLVRTVKLPVEMKFPRHAMETATGNFIVCHGKYLVLQRICEVTPGGNIIRCYDGHQDGGGSGGLGGAYQLNYPRHVTIDADGYVYIADMFNDRVLVLNSELCLCKVIRTGDDRFSGSPRRLCYSPETKLLIVGLHDGRVTVHSVPPKVIKTEI